MIRNVDFPEVKDVAVAIVPETNELNQTDWFVYVVNHGNQNIANLMVTSRGYGTIKNEEVKTSTLRRFLGDLGSKEALKVEPIKEDVFGLNNEYWVSYYQGGQILDKKYLFTAGAISDNHLVDIPVLNTKGIWHP